MSKIWKILICAIFFSGLVHARTVEAPHPSPKALYAMRGQLKKYALASCIHLQSNDPAIEGITGLAAGGYFELGFHGVEAYKAVRNYGKKLRCPGNIVECCLNAIETEEFSNVLKAQDTYGTIPDEKELRADQW